MKKCILISFFFLTALSVHGATIHVPADYTTIQEAIDAAVDGDTVLIADGRYSGPGNVELNPLGKAITIMSENGPDSCSIDGKSETRAFFIDSEETRDTIIRDITITNGYADCGGGIVILFNSSPSFINCIIQDCHAFQGSGAVNVAEGSGPLFDACLFTKNSVGPDLPVGALGCYGDGVDIINCTFTENSAGNNAGAVQLCGEGTINLTDCTFTDNNATNGGSMSIFDTVNVNLNNCTFTGNSSLEQGGAILSPYQGPNLKLDSCVFTDNHTGYWGGSIFSVETNITANNCSFTNNTCPTGDGGAFVSWGPGTILVSNSVFESNFATRGGAVLCIQGSTAEFDTCIFENNTATGFDGAAIVSYSSSPSIHDCVFSNNIALLGGGAISLFKSSGSITSNDFSDNIARRYGGAIFCLKNSDTIIGGEKTLANKFSGNISGAGSDIFSLDIPSTRIIASFNVFESSQGSGYAVWPLEAFDITGSQFNLNPVTQDMFVSTTGDDSNSGLTPSEPMKTIRRAMMQIQGESGSPATIHLAAGNYSESTNGELFPLPMLSNIIVEGESISETSLNAEGNTTLFMGQFNDGFTASHLTLTSGYNDDGGCLYSNSSNWTMNHVVMKNNESKYKGGAIFARSSTAELNHCVIQDNTAGRAGAAYLKDSTFSINNCLITGNTSGNFGGALNSNDAYVDISNCTIAGNTATEDGGSLYTEGSLIPVITNSIIWNNTPNAFSGSVTPDVSYSDVQGFSGGQHNLNVDPAFTSGSSSDYYLSCIEAGQSSDSPCINSGSTMASSVLVAGVPLDQMTTRTDEIPDSGTVDMGFHHDSINACGALGCTVYMPSALFHPGDLCYCDVSVCNPTTETFTDIPVFAILELLGIFFCAPDFSSFDYYEIELPPGETLIHVLPEFYWPSGAGSLDGVNWYAAMTNPEMTQLWGEMDTFTFGWTE